MRTDLRSMGSKRTGKGLSFRMISEYIPPGVTKSKGNKGVSGLGPLYTPFDEVLATADVISLHCPLMPATRNMLAMPEFRKMKRRPLIINETMIDGGIPPSCRKPD